MHRGIGRCARFAAALSLLVACAPQPYRADTPARYLSAAGCVQSNQDRLHATGIYAGRFLTVATRDPAVHPWWEGGRTPDHPEWSANDPYLGRGFEGALTFEIGDRLGFSRDQIRFVPVRLGEAYAPGPKDFDFAIGQLPYRADRSAEVDFSDAYLDSSQALEAGGGSGPTPTLAGSGRLTMLFEDGSPFVECVNLALEELRADGTLAELRRRWLGAPAP